jgi:hypothetical protein
MFFLLIDIANTFNASNIVSVITKTIDCFAVTIIGISAIQTVFPIIISLIKTNRKENHNDNNFALKSFIYGLLFALELESANAILKMGLFASNATVFRGYFISTGNINNFIFFVAILSLRIAINQTLRRYSINKKFNK